MPNYNPCFWNQKRYHSLDYELKRLFGHKVYKLSLNGGMSCPNRDGTLDTRGCIFAVVVDLVILLAPQIAL